MRPGTTNISGMGITSSVGFGVLEFQESLHLGRSNFKRQNNIIFSPLESTQVKEALERLEFFSKEKRSLILKMTRKVGLPIQASILAMAEAWVQANLIEKPLNSEKISLITAGNNTTTQFLFQNYEAYQQEPHYLSPTYAMQFMDTYQLGVLSELFNIQGEGFTTGGASASGNLALIEAARLINSGQSDICVVVGSLADLSPMDLQGFINVGALGGKTLGDHPEKTCRPFDQAHEGFIYGQTAACMILESPESSRKRQVKPLACIKGYASKLQGSHLTDPSEIAESTVMQRAVEMADYKLSDVEYINTHGSSSPIGDITEIAAIKSLFKNKVGNIWLNATKSITGHCLWSAGVVEAIATIIQMENSFLHPNLNLDHPIDTDCRFVGKEAIPAKIEIALSNSFAFSGIHSSLLIERKTHEL